MINIAGDIIIGIGGQSGTLAQSALGSTDPCATRAGCSPTHSPGMAELPVWRGSDGRGLPEVGGSVGGLEADCPENPILLQRAKANFDLQD